MKNPRIFDPRCFTACFAAAVSVLAPAQSAAKDAELIEVSTPATTSEPEFAAQSARSRGKELALDVLATTLVPLSVGPELHVELPGRILVQAHIGWMPELYSATLTDGLQNAGFYDETIGALIDGSFQGATAWRLGAGWRPFSAAGLELTIGYVHVALDGATRTTEVMALLPPELAEELESRVGDVGLNLDSSIGHVTASVGWRWVIAEHLVLSANVGYMQAIHSSSTLEIESYPELTRATDSVVESVLNDHYTRYIKLPVVGLGVGYRFF